MTVAVTLLGALVVALGYLSWKSTIEAKELRTRFSGVLNVQAEIAAAKSEVEKTKAEQRALETAEQARRDQLTKDYQAALARHNELSKEVSLLEEHVNDLSFGLYEPHFKFNTTQEYSTALEQLREREKVLTRSGGAAKSSTTWTVNNDARAGQRMTKQYTKLLLRAFNGECDAAVANVTWNNISKMIERVRKALDAINELGSTMQMSITTEYLNLKLDELRLAFEFEEKKHQEREEQRRIKEQIREEERAQLEIERVKEEAERSEGEYQKLLAKAREEALQATGAQLQKLTTQISSFEQKLDEAREKKERAVARAQLTKSGFVYIISNIGSFGEGVFKVGMTRRMEPMDRVHELGDASVPFAFDLHAMLYSDNAPELEGALHKHFSARQLNLVNARKEFYREIALPEIEEFVKARGLSAQFIPTPEAKEYRQTLALRAQSEAASATKEAAPPAFSPDLFNVAGQGT